MVGSDVSQTTRQVAALRACGATTDIELHVALSRTVRRRGGWPVVPRVISVFRPIDAAPQAIGMPYIVFARNVGGDRTLAEVVAILNGDKQDP